MDEADDLAAGGLLDDLLEAISYVLKRHLLADDFLAVAALPP